MSCSELTKLVKSYTNGEIPLEVYREQRRKIVDKVVDGPKQKQKQKSDPLDVFIASTPQKPGMHGLKSYSVYLTAAGAVLAIGIGAYLALNNRQDSGNPEQTANTDNHENISNNKSQAQKLVDNFLRTDKWNEETINQFILDWQILSPEDRRNAQNTVWFTHFKSIIQKELDKQKIATDKSSTATEDLLTSLLVTVDPGHFIQQPFFTAQSGSALEKPQIETTKPAIVPETQKQAAEPQQPATSQVIKDNIKNKPQPKKPIASPHKIPQAAKAIDYAKLNAVLRKFVRSFQNGDLKTLMHLFSPTATTNYHTSAKEISNSYAELFHTTDARELQFTHFSWKTVGNKTQGSGKYLAHLNPKGTNVDQIFSADVTILLDDASPSPKILGLYLTNQQFSTSLRRSAKATTPSAPTPQPLQKNELKILLTKFVTAYNRGDIEKLMALFSQTARTNDRSNINDIRDDYVQLFQTTRSREIILRNIVWNVDGIRAVANGTFEVKIRPSSGGSEKIYRGKIRIAVTKFEGGILITQFLHNTF